MDATDSSRAFAVLARTTFRATVFVAALVLLSHGTYGLRDQLKSSSTSAGIAAFAVLMTTTAIATRRELRKSRADDPEDRMGEIIVAGAHNGLCLLVAVAVSIVGRAVLTPPGPAHVAILLVPFILVFGFPIAVAVGGVAAFPFALVEPAIEDIVNRLCRWVDCG
jgi:hypothetical protein